MPANKPLIVEIWDFLKVRKAWWIAPLVILLIITALLVIFVQSSSILSPALYALF